jgi:hypothetical protein
VGFDVLGLLSLGTVEYEVTNLDVTDLVRPNVSVSVGPPLQASMENARANVSGEFKYFLLLSNTVPFSLSIGGVSVNAIGGFSPDANGKPVVSVQSCEAKVGSVEIDIQGSSLVAGLYNYLTSLLKSVAVTQVQTMLCNVVTEAITVNANQELQKLELNVPLGNDHTCDSSLMSPPSLGQDFIEFSIKGECSTPGSTTSIPFTPEPIPTIPTSNKMGTIIIGEHVLNTVAHSVHQQGKLSKILTKDNTQGGSDFLVTTCDESNPNCFGGIFPAAASSYPDCQVQLATSFVERPTVTFVPTGAVIPAKFTIGASATQCPTSTTTLAQAPLFTVLVNANFTGNATVEGNSIKFRLTDMQSSTSVVTTNIGPLPERGFDPLVEFVKDGFVEPLVTGIGRVGATLPSLPGMNWTDTSLDFHNGALVVGTNCEYVFP